MAYRRSSRYSKNGPRKEVRRGTRESKKEKLKAVKTTGVKGQRPQTVVRFVSSGITNCLATDSAGACTRAASAAKITQC